MVSVLHTTCLRQSRPDFSHTGPHPGPPHEPGGRDTPRFQPVVTFGIVYGDGVEILRAKFGLG